jgi:hypothetical protein
MYLKRDLSINAERSLFVVRMVERFSTDAGENVLPEIYRAAMASVIATDARLNASMKR